MNWSETITIRPRPAARRGPSSWIEIDDSWRDRPRRTRTPYWTKTGRVDQLVARLDDGGAPRWLQPDEWVPVRIADPWHSSLPRSSPRSVQPWGLLGNVPAGQSIASTTPSTDEVHAPHAIQVGDLSGCLPSGPTTTDRDHASAPRIKIIFVDPGALLTCRRFGETRRSAPDHRPPGAGRIAMDSVGFA